VPSACAPCERYLRSFTASHGEPKPLLKGSVLPEPSCSQALDQTQMPPAGLAPGWLQDRARIVVGHQGSGYPVASAPEALADREAGVKIVQPWGAPS
jgi:hypothetical protein